MPRGSKPGERRGGRTAGVPNKRTAEQAEAVKASGLTPLDYLLSVMRDDALDRDARVDAAKAAAPYVHARLAAVEHSGGIAFSHEDALAELDDEPEGAGNPSEAEG